MRLFLAVIILSATAVTTTLLYRQTQQADINYYRGHRFFEKDEYARAIEYCRKALAVNPSHGRALIDLAYSYQRTGNLGKAAEAFNQILSMDPGDYKVMMALAEVLAWNKEYEKSIALCKEIIASTGDVEAQLLLGQVYIWDRQFDDAKEILQELLSSEPDNPRAKLLYAKALHYSGEAKKAIEIYKELLEGKKEAAGGKR